jgi:hypothetical protein
MFARLRELHLEILDKLGELDHLVMSDQPQIERLMGVRHGLTRASRARTMLLEREIYPRLLSGPSVKMADDIRRLQAEGKQDLATSSQHIGRWSLRTITEQWEQYRTASNSMRAAMRRRVKVEQELLYPLLAAIPT